MKPIIYKSKPKRKDILNFVEARDSAVDELFFISQPKIKKGAPEASEKLQSFRKNNKIGHSWIYFPESKILVHTVDEKNYFTLRTARNKNLITEAEQSNFRNMNVGIAGLSVGSAVLSALVISGGPKNLKIADFDVLEISNLNRIRGTLQDIGKNKTHIAAREVWNIDPFCNVITYDEGLTISNLASFLTITPKLSVFVDEMDDIKLKIKARLLCREKKIPVIMATDNGDSVVLDVERFDLEPHREIFHGLLKKSDYANLDNLVYREWLKLATKIVGPEYLTLSMQQSILEIGKSLPAVPQLGTVASVAGASMCLVLRRIANDQSMPSGRYVISLEEKLLPGYTNKKNILQRKKHTQLFKQNFG